MNDRLVDEHVMTRTVIEEDVNLAENKIHQSIAESVDKLRQELLEREKDKEISCVAIPRCCSSYASGIFSVPFASRVLRPSQRPTEIYSSPFTMHCHGRGTISGRC
ncbi:hypothetical protein BFJ66_g12650 [Fusarium oxysporum f. sp. cepae]|uniref:Uncharacterized protein n=1 Tax=Fusarium oxysporum f. sp. cepae TaxID=396571 RepID=A0A3L6NRV8_FUSOX|nr:hypothetical protein BFJ65_g7277 [Fusarium oxysporum f. sp. cepae]RKK36852.1 hypothetical protein BFJ67_g12639 [Fusarium oxysporum f. sp. cepae]RKK38050.1 hypothetical protein BFJ66_g12650 [Fusarium oxysporum f. sp. cepae]